MRAFITLLAFVGLLMLAVGYINQTKQCPAPRIEYRYLPRTFEEEQDNPVKVSQIFRHMFEAETPWLHGTSLGGAGNRVDRPVFL